MFVSPVQLERLLSTEKKCNIDLFPLALLPVPWLRHEKTWKMYLEWATRKHETWNTFKRQLWVQIWMNSRNPFLILGSWTNQIFINFKFSIFYNKNQKKGVQSNMNILSSFEFHCSLLSTAYILSLSLWLSLFLYLLLQYFSHTCIVGIAEKRRQEKQTLLFKSIWIIMGPTKKKKKRRKEQYNGNGQMRIALLSLAIFSTCRKMPNE